MVGIYAQQIGNVGKNPLIQTLPLRGGVLFDQVAPVVLHRHEAIGDVLLFGLFAVLEDQANLGADQRCPGQSPARPKRC